jgi:iron complex transport system substrate-binding protein
MRIASFTPRRALRPIAALALAFALIPALTASSAFAITVRDAAGRDITVNDTSRIVSVGGAVTEILYALGLADRIIAIDTTSLYPARALKEKPNVGYMRALSAEGVLGLNPSLVLAIEGAGPKETVAVLEQASVPLVRVPDHYTAEGIVEKVRLIANVAGIRDHGECLAGQVADDLGALEKLRTKITRPKKVLFVLSFLNGKPMVAGRNTAADGIIRLAGGVNAMDSYEGYRQIADEAVIAAAPDAVLAMQRPQDNLDATTVFANAAFSTTPAAAEKSFIAMDGLYLLGFGPRTAGAARDLAATLYPSLGRDVLPSERKTSDCY